nr:ABC transporter substrate-binding protein [uncultured Cohaesibacter sp.]
MTKKPSNTFPLGKGMSRRHFLGATAASGFALSASGLLLPKSAFAAETPKKGGHLKLGIKGGAATDILDPALSSGSVTFLLNHLWGDKIVGSDPETGAPLPSLAEAWESTPDATVWTFKIRKGVAFHDGSTMGVHDVVQTLKRHTDQDAKSGALGLLRSIKSVEEKAGDMVITLTESNADLPLLLTDYHLMVQPNGGYDDANAGIGTGPYKLESFEAGIRATFVKNENDWDDSRGHVDSVEVIVMNDNTARIAALSSGQVHFINFVEPKTINLLKRAPNVEILQTHAKGYYSFQMFCDTAPFDNNDLRLALKYAVDRQEILDRVVGGYGSLGNDYPVNSTYQLAPDDIEQRMYDPDKAAFHFKKSGHEGSILLRTSDAAFPGAVDAAVLYQQHAKKAGIDIEVKREPADGYWSNVWNATPFCATYWGGRPTQDLRYATSYLSTADWNDSNFKRPDFDKMLLEARAELDSDKRKALYRQMAIMVRDEGGSIIPVFNDFLNGASKSLKGFVHDIGNDISNGQIASRVWLDV